MSTFRGVWSVAVLALALVLGACSPGGGAAQPTTAPKPAATNPAATMAPASGASPAASAAPSPQASAGEKPTVRVGSTNFSEQVTLAELYAQVLEANGYRVERKLNLGSREIVEPALESGEIDLMAEYLATLLRFVDPNAQASSDPAATQQALQQAIAPKGLTVLSYAPAVDTNAFAVRKDTADQYHLAKLSDLAPVAKDLVLGGPPECPQRPFCQQGLEQTYGLHFKDFKPLDVGGPLTVTALEGRQIDVGLFGSTDAVAAQRGFVFLEDDKHLQLADNVAPVVRTDLLNRAPADFKTLLDSVSKQLTTQELVDLNKSVDVDRKDSKDVAAAWLKAKGLVK